MNVRLFCVCVRCMLHVHPRTLLAGSMCQWLIPPSLGGEPPLLLYQLSPLPVCLHPLLSSTDGLFYFPKEY